MYEYQSVVNFEFSGVSMYMYIRTLERKRSMVDCLEDPISPTLRREHVNSHSVRSRSSVKCGRIIELIGSAAAWFGLTLGVSPVSHGPSLVNGGFFFSRSLCNYYPGQ